MNILIAEDEMVSRCLLDAALTEWGYKVTHTEDGEEACNMLLEPDGPKLAILDWMMPGMDGIEVCRRVHEAPTSEPPYCILLTGRCSKEDIVRGLQSGANDYITKPFNREELHARVQVGSRVVALQHNLAERVRELGEMLAHVNQLQGLLPICSYCKRIRNERDYWQQVETYIASHSEAVFSHGICPSCFDTVVKPELERAKSHRATRTAAAPRA